MNNYQFPDDFIWGTSTSSYQIEGAFDRDGRLPSVWDTFSDTPGRVLNGDTGKIACEHYDRYPDDIKLMRDLGIKNYRFSLSWCRIIPEGRGQVNQRGLDFYQRLIDCLLEHDITPYVALFHWDSPQALENLYGSWQSREIAQDFADYTTVAVNALGDRVTNWITINEISCFTHMGYGVEQTPPHAPGTVVKTVKDIWQTSHHALLAHGLGVQAIRATSPRPCFVSLIDNFVVTVPLTETVADIQATQKAFHLQNGNGGIIFPALTGRYSELLLEQLGDECPDIRDGDLEIIHQPLDSLGLNIYSGVYVRSNDSKIGYEVLKFPSGYPKLHMPWLQVVPDSLYWSVRHVSETLNRPNLPIFITENGCAADDHLIEGEIIDSDRIFYLRQYLKTAHRAVSEGYPLKGYFLWSLLDNFEWSWGFDRRFGMVYVDYLTQNRIPKASAYWYAECLKQNRVV